jgi:endoglycosylceramidase
MRWCWPLLLAACSGAYQPRFTPVDSDGNALRDARGRTVILRGVNARVDGVFDVGFDDGRAPREAIPSFDASDVQQLSAAGFNLLRLPLSWSALEPMPGQYSTQYLDRVQAVVDLCRGSRILVLLDLHQDGYSKEICEDGAPLWAINPPLTQLVGGPGPLQGPVDCHTARAALSAFDAFFADQSMLQERYQAMATQLATRFRSSTQVLGYEVMNEPIGDEDAIAAFSAKIAAAIRAVDPDHLVLFEPSSTRNFTNASPFASAPFAVAGGVYAVHVYTAVFGSDPSFADGSYPPKLAASIASAREEATSWGTPLVITEYGASASSAGAGWIGHFLDDADAQGASTALWLWKEQSQGQWGLYTIQPDGSWTPRPIMFDAASRPYAQAVGGDVDSVAWDGAQLTVAFHGHGGVPSLHDIFWNQGTPSATCDGAAVAPSSSDGPIYTFACSGHTLVIR